MYYLAYALYSCVMSIPPISTFTSDCWQKAKPVKPVRVHTKVGSQLDLNWLSMILDSVLIFCLFQSQFHLYSSLSFLVIYIYRSLISTD